MSITLYVSVLFRYIDSNYQIHGRVMRDLDLVRFIIIKVRYGHYAMPHTRRFF